MKLFGNKRSKRAADNAPKIDENPVFDEILPDDMEFAEQDMTLIDETISEDIELGESVTVFNLVDDSETEQADKPKRFRLTGLHRGLIILGAAIVLLVVMATAMWVNFAKPPDVLEATPAVSAADDDPSGQQGTAATAKVTTTTVLTENPDTGEIEELMIEVPVGRKEGFYTILLVGTDQENSLTDTIMVASFDITNNSLNIISVPRDTISNGKWNVPKINSVYSVGGQGEEGMELLKDKLSDILGIPFDCYALIDLSAFTDIIDAIGGVWFDVPQNMNYYDPTQDFLINLTKGEQLLDGNKAEMLVRFRSGYASADIGRMQVQQDFMKACAKQLLQSGNYLKIARILSDNLMTNLSLGNLAYFGQSLLKLSVDDINTVTLPGNAISWGGLSYYALYGADVLDIVNEYLNPYDTDLTIDDINPLTVSGGVRVKSTRSASAVTAQVSTSTSTYSSTTPSSSPQPSASVSPSPEPEPEVSPEPENGGSDTTQEDVPPAESSTAEPEAQDSSVPQVETRPEELPGGDESNLTPASATIAG